MTASPRIMVHTYKEGLLSRLAHDLRLTVQRFDVQLTEGQVTATLSAASLKVDGAMRKGVLAPDVLSETDRTTIERTLSQEILRASTHPDVVFRGTLSRERGGLIARGSLNLNGRDQPLDLPVVLENAATIDVEVAPSRWGIAPYRAMAGALKVQDRVRVVIELPLNATDSTEWQTMTRHWSSP